MCPKKFVRKFCPKKMCPNFFFRSRRITLKSTYLQYLQIIRGIIISALHKTTKKYLKQNKQQFQVLWGQPEIRYIYIIYDNRKPHGNWKCSILQSTVQRTIISVYHQIQKRSSLTNVSIANDVMCAVLCFCWNSCHNRNIIIRANRPKITKTKKK